MAIQACATYDNPPLGSAGGSGAVAGEDGGSSEKAGNGGAGSSAGASRAGDAAGGNSGAAAGVPGEGGMDQGGAGASPMSAGEGGAATFAGAGAGGVEVGGAGGSGACDSTAPEVGCVCAAHEAHDYWFCPTFLTLGAAEAKCKAAGMHLPKVESKTEDDWLFATAAQNSLGEYFLGATDATTPDEWSWLAGGKLWSGQVDGTAYGYANWSSNEPNGSGDCLVVQSNGPWDDRTCSDQRKYVCEAP